MPSPTEIYNGSSGELTRELYRELEQRGPSGMIALNLFRAQKCSSRAKKYHGGIPGKGSYKDMAYDRKQWSMSQLCTTLQTHAESLGIIWGWKIDPFQPYHNQVLYINLPTGQVSFHTNIRGSGPDYPGDWDGEHLSAERIIEYVDAILKIK